MYGCVGGHQAGWLVGEPGKQAAGLGGVVELAVVAQHEQGREQVGGVGGRLLLNEAVELAVVGAVVEGGVLGHKLVPLLVDVGALHLEPVTLPQVAAHLDRAAALDGKAGHHLRLHVVEVDQRPVVGLERGLEFKAVGTGGYLGIFHPLGGVVHHAQHLAAHALDVSLDGKRPAAAGQQRHKRKPQQGCNDVSMFHRQYCNLVIAQK